MWSDHEAKGVVWRAIGVRMGSRERKWHSRGTTHSAGTHAVQSMKELKSSASKQGHDVHPCTAFPPFCNAGSWRTEDARRAPYMPFPCFWYAERTPLEGALRAPLHGVQLPKSGCSYKKGSWRKEKPFFPNSIFPDFSRVFPAKTSTKTPLEAKLKIQRSSYWRIEVRIEDRRSRASIGRRTSRYFFVRRWLGFLFNCFLLEWWVAKSFGILGWDVGIELWNLSWMFKNNVCGCLIWNERLSWLFGCST